MSTNNGQEPGQVAPENGDGLTTPHSQPAEQCTTDTTDFIASCNRCELVIQHLMALIRGAEWLLAIMVLGFLLIAWKHSQNCWG